MSSTIEIIKVGTVFSDSFEVSVAYLINDKGEKVPVTKTGIELELSTSTGISLLNSNVTAGTTYNSTTKKWLIPSLTSGAPVYFSFQAEVTDDSFQNFQVILTATNFPDDSTPDNNQFIKVFSGLTQSDIEDSVQIVLANDPTLKGDQGDPGPANTLTIGSITEGTASATITGTAPNQVLDLVIPKGDTGEGDILSIGTVSTGVAGSNVIATITGTSPNKLLNLTIPRGADGLDGLQDDWGNQVIEHEVGSLSSGDGTATDKLNVQVSKTYVDALGVNAATVNGLTVQTAVPLGALFTDNDTQRTDVEIFDLIEASFIHANHTNVTVVRVNDEIRITGNVSGSGADGNDFVSNITRSGNDLVFTGTGGAFTGTIPDVFLDTNTDTQNEFTIQRGTGLNIDNLLFFKNGSQIASIPLCCVVSAADVGLGNVPNVDATDRTNHTGLQPISTVTGLQTELNSKQNTLSSGVNIKTINGTSILGSGNIDISGNDDQTASEVLLTGYVKPTTSSAIVATDNVNQALGKLERSIEDETEEIDLNISISTNKGSGGFSSSSDGIVTVSLTNLTSTKIEGPIALYFDYPDTVAFVNVNSTSGTIDYNQNSSIITVADINGSATHTIQITLSSNKTDTFQTFKAFVIAGGKTSTADYSTWGNRVTIDIT